MVVPAVYIMGEKVLLTVEALSEEQNASGEGGEVNRETRRNKDVKAQEHDQGIRGEEWKVELSDRGGWLMGDDDSHGVESSIAGGVGEMVRAQLQGGFFFFFSI